VSHRRQNDYHAIAAADCAAGAQLSARESLILHELRTSGRTTIAAIDCVAHNYPRASLSFCLRDSLFFAIAKIPAEKWHREFRQKSRAKKAAKKWHREFAKKTRKNKKPEFCQINPPDLAARNPGQPGSPLYIYKGDPG